MANATTIAGRYRIEGRLGVGGMATVQLAFDQRLERYVALKLLAEHLADDPAFVSRFRREALSAARLVHPNIVQVFDFGFDEHQHQHFIVMEHVPGQSCAELLRDRGHLDVEFAIDVLVQACRGLDYAHRNGVVHRDVKPGNLLVSEAQVVKLADFGIARATDQSSITQVGSVLGTAAYLAPEQARGEEAGPRADLYSLGVVAYQLLSGRLPYEASSLSELALKQQREAPAPLDEINPRVPPELGLAVASALAIEQEDRPRDAIVLGDALRNGAAGIRPPRTAATRARQRDGAPESRQATRVVGAGRGSAPTSATRMAAARAANGPVTPPPPPVRRLEPRRPAPGQPAERYARRAQPYPDRRRSRSGRGARRLLGLLALCCVLAAAIIVALTIANSTSNTALHIRHVVTSDVNSAIDSLRGVIKSNTK
jgi:eukaryotic-like serine/threonine-protein kinase